MKKSQIIQRILDKLQGKNYLEIGVSGGENFSLINSEYKTGVDPIPPSERIKSIVNKKIKYYSMTSDDFFKELKEDQKFDVIFIDGLHHYFQAIKDVLNSLKHLKENGVIIMHDCNPTSKGMQEIPRIQLEWTGNVWKAIVSLRSQQPNLNIFVLKGNYGLGIITKQKPETTLNYSEQEIENLPYEELEKNRTKLLNLKEQEYLEKFLETLSQ